MAKKLDILNELSQAIANPVPIGQPVTSADIADIQANKVVQQPVIPVQPAPVKQLTPAEQFQEELKSSGMGASEYLYRKSHPAPLAPDEKALRRQRTLANITDLGLLLTEGIGAVAGGNVNRRQETATGNANTQAERLQQVYDRQYAQYGDDIYNARAKDNQYAKEIELQKAKRVQELADTKTKNDREDELFKKKQDWEGKIYGVKTKAQEEKDAKDKAFTSKEKQLDRNARATLSEKSAAKTEQTKAEAKKPPKASHVAVNNYLVKYLDDPKLGVKALAAYYLDHGADTPQEAMAQAVKDFKIKK